MRICAGYFCQSIGRYHIRQSSIHRIGHVRTFKTEIDLFIYFPSVGDGNGMRSPIRNEMNHAREPLIASNASCDKFIL